MSNTLREKYFEQFVKNCLDSVELTKRKNLGYTGGTDDPFANFRFAAQMASVPSYLDVTVAQTILSRMADKISRFKSLTVRPDAAFDESLADTLKDLFVYANILLTWEQLGHPEPSEAQLPQEEESIAPLTQGAEQSLTAAAATNVAAGLKKLFNWK